MTNSKLWHADDGDNLHELIEHYTVGNDQVLDQALLGYDITATKAHAHMLNDISILTDEEYKKLASGLDDLLAEWQNGSFKITSDHEDGHTAIELYLTEKIGDVGKKVHTGRSRNDQALVMMRLYLKDNLQKTIESLKDVVDAYDTKIKDAGKQDMPGYTHTQKAMPTTVATWLGAYRDAFEDLMPFLQTTIAAIDQNPLGSAAGFGVSLPLNRDMTTRELGFAKTQENPIYCGMSRGTFELMAVQALTPLMTFAGKFAQDMIQFTTQDTHFFSLPKSMTTGSSIMPHKRNYDVFEIMRANSHEFSSRTIALYSVIGGVGSGYHRDLQLTKDTTLRAFTVALETLDVLSLCVRHIVIHHKTLDAAMTGELHTVTEINKLVAQGVPFRDAYQQVKRSLNL